MHILFIEPDRLLARTYRQALELAGHTVHVAATAQAAVQAADEQRPDVVILELQLVGHSGIEFLYEFRSYDDWQAVPVVVLSLVPPGEFAGSRQLLAEQLGVHNYLYKPHTSLAKLQRTINQYTPVA